VGGAAGQDPGVRGGNVPVIADDDRDAAISVLADNDFLGGEVAVEVHDSGR
jgi:hypothetical protein